MCRCRILYVLKYMSIEEAFMNRIDCATCGKQPPIAVGEEEDIRNGSIKQAGDSTSDGVSRSGDSETETTRARKTSCDDTHGKCLHALIDPESSPY